MDNNGEQPRSVRQAMATSVATSYVCIVIYFFGTILLARLLTPREIGIYSIGAVIIAVGHTIRDFGIGQYIIHEKDLTTDRLRCAFTLTVFIAWSIAAVLAAASGPISAFYSEPGVQTVILILSINFFLIPFGSVVRAYWRRNLDFSPIFIESIASALAGTVAAVTLAYHGYGYKSQAIAVILASIVTISITWILRPRDFPLRPGLKGFRRIFSFSSWLTSANIITETSAGLPDMVVGRIDGAEAVGFLGKAIGTLKIFEHVVISGIFPVILPHYASLVRRKVGLADAFLKSVNYLTCLAWPFFAFLFFSAEPLIHILYGKQWDASIPLVKILVLYGMFSAMLSTSTNVLVAMGAVKRILLISLLTNPAKLILLILLTPLGLEYAALALVLSQALNLLVNTLFLYPIAGTTIGAVLRSVRGSLLVAALSSIGPFMVSVYAQDYGIPEGFQLLISILSCMLLWYLAIQVTRHPLRLEIAHVISSVRQRLFAKTD